MKKTNKQKNFISLTLNMLKLAMEMVLTGDQMTAQEAILRGLVSRVVSKEKSLEVALELAKKIADKPRLISKLTFTLNFFYFG